MHLYQVLPSTRILGVSCYVHAIVPNLEIPCHRRASLVMWAMWADSRKVEVQCTPNVGTGRQRKIRLKISIKMEDMESKAKRWDLVEIPSGGGGMEYIILFSFLYVNMLVNAITKLTASPRPMKYIQVPTLVPPSHEWLNANILRQYRMYTTQDPHPLAAHVPHY